MSRTDRFCRPCEAVFQLMWKFWYQIRIVSQRRAGLLVPLIVCDNDDGFTPTLWHYHLKESLTTTTAHVDLEWFL